MVVRQTSTDDIVQLGRFVARVGRRRRKQVKSAKIFKAPVRPSKAGATLSRAVASDGFYDFLTTSVRHLHRLFKSILRIISRR